MKTEGRDLGIEILQGIKEIQRYKKGKGKSKSLKLREIQVDLNSETLSRKAASSRQK